MSMRRMMVALTAVMLPLAPSCGNDDTAQTPDESGDTTTTGSAGISTGQGTSAQCDPSTRPRAEDDGDVDPARRVWGDFVEFDGVKYAAAESWGPGVSGRPVLGDTYATVCVTLDDTLVPADYEAQDGDAGQLAVGTELSTLEGEDPGERLGRELSDGRIVVYVVGATSFQTSMMMGEEAPTPTSEQP